MGLNSLTSLLVMKPHLPGEGVVAVAVIRFEGGDDPVDHLRRLVLAELVTGVEAFDHQPHAGGAERDPLRAFDVPMQRAG